MGWSERAYDPSQHDVPRTLDITPTWVGMLPLLLEGFTNTHNPKGQEAAAIELGRMAQAADKWNAHVAQEESKSKCPNGFNSENAWGPCRSCGELLADHWPV